MVAGTNQTAEGVAAAPEKVAAEAVAEPTSLLGGTEAPEQKEAKASETKPEAKAETKAEAKSQAPEKYEFKAPDGQSFDTEVINAYSAVAKELGLTQDAAQKVLDSVGPVMQKRQAAQIEAVRQEWVTQTKADPEFGGPQGEANLALAKKALVKFGSPSLQKLLNETGLGNRLEIIQWAHKVGKAISDDSFVSGNQTEPPKDPAKIMFPNMK